MNLSGTAETALRVVREAKRIAYDTEGSGVDWKRSCNTGYVITSEDFNCYIPVRHGGGQNLPGCKPLLKASREPGETVPVHPWERELAKAFKERGRLGYKTIGHNMKFDLHASLNHGIEITGDIECTQLNAAMIDEFAGKYSLAACCQRAKVTAKLGEPMYEHLARLFGGEAKSDQMSNFWRLSGLDPVGVDYAMGDGVSTLELWEQQQGDIEEMRLLQIWGVEQRLQRHIMRMERFGIRIDEEMLHAARADLVARITEAERVLPDNFNPKSPIAVEKYMRDNGVSQFDKTASGRNSFNEKFLLKTDAGRAIVKSRKMKTLLNSFIDPMINTHMWNGRVHTTLNQLRSDEHGVIAGRFSSSDPNLQQISRRDQETGLIHRSIFVSDPGHTFYEADYSQCEPRLFAHYSESPTLIAGYNANPPVDMHSNTAKLLGVERDPTAKRMGMGILTGMFPKTLAEHMDWDVAKSTEMYNAFMRAFPELQQFQKLAKQVMQQRGYVRTLLGRVCHMDDPRYAYRAVSRIIQGGNADILKYKMLAILDELEQLNNGTTMMLTVHDSLIWQSPDGDAETSKRIVAVASDVQSAPFNLLVPFKMDVKKGKDWAEATFGVDACHGIRELRKNRLLSTQSPLASAPAKPSKSVSSSTTGQSGSPVRKSSTKKKSGTA